MHLYNLSQELVKGLEQAVQEEKNDSLRQQYQTLLQQQRNATASLKSLGQTHESNEQTSAQAYDTEFGSESYMNTSEMRNTSTQQTSSYSTNDNASATNQMEDSQAKTSKRDKK